MSLAIPDTGMITVKIGAVEQPVDVYYANNRVWELQEKNRDEEDGVIHKFHSAVVLLLGELGFPGANHFQASKFVDGIRKAVEELGKAESGEPTPNSPDSTVPASSPSPPASS